MVGNKVRKKFKFIKDFINLSQAVISSLKQEEIFHQLSISTSIGENHKSSLGLESFFSQKICQKEIKWLKPLKFLKINLSGIFYEDIFSSSDQLKFFNYTKKPEFQTSCNFHIYNYRYEIIKIIKIIFSHKN